MRTVANVSDKSTEAVLIDSKLIKPLITTEKVAQLSCFKPLFIEQGLRYLILLLFKQIRIGEA